MVTVRVTDNTPFLINDFSQKANVFLRLMAENIVKISEPSTPKKTGRLRMDVLKQVLGLNGKIIWTKDYAAKMETEQFRNYTTAGTGPHYAENSVKTGLADTGKIAKISGLI